MRALFALLGAGIGAAVLLVGVGLRRRPRPQASTSGRPARAGRWPATAGRVAAALGAAALVGAATRWPVAAALGAVAAWRLPAVLGPDRQHRHSLDRIEAIAAWAEDLAGTLRSAAGIEQAIIATAAVAPVPIRPELHRLAEALRAGVRLPLALRVFAADLADPSADTVVHVLLQAAQYQARDIAAVLSGLGRRVRRKASARLRIATSRAATRTSIRIVIAVMVGTAAALVLFAPELVRPYGSPLGQLALAVLGALFAAALAWLVRTGRVPDLPRILGNPREPTR